MANLPDSIPKPPADAETLQAEVKAKKTSNSFGEKAFNLATYGGIGFGAVFAAGIPLGYGMKYGKGAKYYANAAKSLQKMGMSAHAAENVAMTTTLMMPGNAALIPIGLLETHKPTIVEELNQLRGDKSGDASVDNDPKQGVGSLVASRLAAWGAVFATFHGTAKLVGKEKVAAFEEKFSEHIYCKLFRQPTHVPGLPKIPANKTPTCLKGEIAATDIVATLGASLLLFLGTRIFSKFNPRWHARDLPNNATPASVNDNIDKSAISERSIKDDTPSDNGKLFADTVAPANKPIAIKTKTASFADTITRQKAMTNAMPLVNA